MASLLSFVCGGASLLSTPIAVRAQQESATSASLRRNYTGDAACGACHVEIADSYRNSAHHRTSQLPDKTSIAGSFAEGKNLLFTRERDLHFRMEANDKGFFETAIFFQPPDQQTHTERIDLVTGSGEKGQTYLYWKADRLFQLPVSFWSVPPAWVNSPGYADGTAEFDRPIVPRCLECHATYFKSLPSETAQNRYSQKDFVLGISCERCHGPGHAHADAERSKSPAAARTATAAGSSAAITNPSGLPRDRQIDICAQCHGGIGEPRKPAFSFSPGKSLAEFIQLQPPGPDERLDVHGNQVALLERSRCYQDPRMTCSTCHNVHAPEKPASAHSTQCLQCHKPQDCGEFSKHGAKIAENCIDCHMPLQDSSVIVSQSHGTQVKEQVRNHWIKVYPDTDLR